MEIQPQTLTEITNPAESYANESELNDMRQHANKIIQGIKKLNNYDSARAIWELFQNAVDLSKECHVEIALTDNIFIFSHNGEPFNPMTLDCLFKQVSSKTLKEKKLAIDENDPIGQYGTGFMTSHAFGNHLAIDGALTKVGGLVPFQNFVIDRDTDNWLILAQRITHLKKEVINLLKQEVSTDSSNPRTVFKYQMVTEGNHQCAEAALKSLPTILPYVMTLNPKLKTVKVNDRNGETFLYEKDEPQWKEAFWKMKVSVNGESQEICYLENKDEHIAIILPITAEFIAFDFEELLPRLFLYYPLVGTHDWGMNFLLHSRRFQPTEPRNGIYLATGNASNLKDEQANKLLIEKASTLLFDFLTANVNRITNPVKLAKVDFNVTSDKEQLLNTYFQGLKSSWITALKELELVETSEKRKSPAQSRFFHEELLRDEKYFPSIYKLASKYWNNIPKQHLVYEWTARMEEWEIPESQWINIKELAAKIDSAGNLATVDDTESLKICYRYLLDNGYSECFDMFKLLPNIKGNFRTFGGNEGLCISLDLTRELIEIADVILPDLPKRFVNEDFKFGRDFPKYNRKNYSTDINEQIAKLVGDKTTSDQLDPNFLQMLIRYAKVTSTAESDSVPTKMMKSISKFYLQQGDMTIIPAVQEDKLDVTPIQKRLIKMFLNDIAKKDSQWVAGNIEFLKIMMAAGSKYEAYEDIFKTLPVFPNQLNELMPQSALKIDSGIPDDILTRYDNVVKPDLPIKANLVHPEFKDFLYEKSQKTVRELTEKIEGMFFNEYHGNTIEDNPFKDHILGVIEQIKNNVEYEQYYPLVTSKRSGILVQLADGKDTFIILSMEPKKIKALAEIARSPHLAEIVSISKIPNFVEIFNLGREAFEKKQQENASLEHKKTLGTHMESILRENLTHILPETIKAEVQEKQNGQDIVISIDGKELYYIEVKSRWNHDTPVRMSKNQTIQADQQKDNYALCTVDMTQYTGENRFGIKDIAEVASCIHFNEDIGYQVGHLIPLLEQSTDPDTFYLDGEYRTSVPMKYIYNGRPLDFFEKYLIQFLQRATTGV